MLALLSTLVKRPKVQSCCYGSLEQVRDEHVKNVFILILHKSSQFHVIK